MMNIADACEILRDIARDHGEDVLTTCVYMSENRRDFEPHEVMALDTFMRVGREFFADVEESV